MSFWQSIKYRFMRRRTLRQKAEWAYGLWLAGPQTTNSTTFISNITGIPHNKVWGTIYGKKDNNE